MVLPFKFIGKQQYTDYRKKLWQRDPHCVYCHKRCKWMGSTLDHIIPQSRGGLDTPSNLVLACEACNTMKADRSMVEWANDLIQACRDAGQSIVVETEAGVQ